MRKSWLIIAVLWCSGSILAQNTQRFSQLQFAQGILNPAAINFDAAIMADLIMRDQWMGFDGAPVTYGFNGQYELDQNMAFGLSAFHDRIGIQQNTSVMAQYAYRIQLNNRQVIAVGMQAGIDNKVADLASVYTIQAGDPTFSQSYAKTYFNAGLGVMYRSPSYYVGISVPQFFQNNFRGFESGLVPPRWHYYLTAGAFWGDRERYVFNPIIQIKATRNAPIQGDIILRNTFQNKISFSVGYRSENSIIAGFDFTIRNVVRLGYAANYDIGKLSKWGGLSNEIYLGFGFPYHHDRDEFFVRKYVNRKGGFRRRYSNASNRKRSRK